MQYSLSIAGECNDCNGLHGVFFSEISQSWDYYDPCGNFRPEAICIKVYRDRTHSGYTLQDVIGICNDIKGLKIEIKYL